MTSQRIHVISDLHLGGAPATGSSPGFQMCPPAARQRLARFVDRLTAEPDGAAETELVINGDFVDFLAEPSAGGGAPVFTAFRTSEDDALAALDALVEHVDGGAPEGARVFAALGRYARAGRRLTVLLGNHDVELALPRVRRALLDRLTGGAPARVEFLHDGEAYARGPVLVEHGNRYDGWNVVDQHALRALRSALSRGEAPPEFPVQPGSRLVVDVMNPLKARYRFLDLLKPENEAAIPILAALEPDAVGEIGRVAALLGHAARLDHQIGSNPALESMAVASRTGDPLTDALLFEAEAAWGAPPPAAADAGALESFGDGVASWLSSARGAWRRWRDGALDAARLRALRAAFVRSRAVMHATFDPLHEDARYLRAAERLAGERRRVVVFGHTHLAKSVPLSERAHYLNSGAWCPTIRLDASWYDPEAPEARALDDLRAFLDDLAQNRTDRWCRLDTTVATVEYGDGPVRATLSSCDDDGALRTLHRRELD